MVVTGVILLIIALVLAPVIHSITYAVPSSDDFWKATVPAGTNVFASAFHHANWFYMNWYGGWIWEFTEVLLNPLVYFDATSSAYGYFLIGCLLCFLGALALLVRDVFVYVFGCRNRNIWLGAFAGILIVFFNAAVWTEVFYWFCGSTYARAMTLMLLTVDLVIRNYDHYSMGKSILTAIVGGIACTSYTETIFPGMVFLAFILVDTRRTGKFDWKKAYPLAVMIAGGITTVIAPGNRARYAVEQEGEMMSAADYLPALKNSIYMAAKEAKHVFQSPIAICFFLLMVIVGYWIFSESRHRFSVHKYLALFVGSGICLVMTYYPFILGYAGTDYIPNRMLFVFVVYAILLLGLNGAYIGGILSQKMSTSECHIRKRFAVISVIAVCILGICGIGASGYWRNTPIYRIIALEEPVKYAHDMWVGVIEEIENSDSMDVRISRPYFETLIIKPMGIAETTESLQCKNMAGYFERETLLMIWTY